MPNQNNSNSSELDILNQRITDEITNRGLSEANIRAIIERESNRAEDEENEIENRIRLHENDLNNPHNVTKDQVELGHVIDTGDSDTPAEGGREKFTTGGAYVLKQSIDSEISRATRADATLKNKVSLHVNDINNPHNVTKAQIGLSDVVNTGDSDTPVEDGLTKFTSGGAYVLQQRIAAEETNRKAYSVNHMIVNQDSETGYLVFELYNIDNTLIDTKTLELNIGKLIDSFALNLNAEKIVATCIDGSEIEIDLSDLIDDYNLKITNINDNIDDIGSLIGFEYDENNDEWILSTNGLVQLTKNTADNNKSRLDNLEAEISVLNQETTISHDLTVEGDLVVKGTTTTTDQETIQAQSTLILTNSTNTPLVDYTGIVALKGSYAPYEVAQNKYKKDTYYYKDANDKYVLDSSTSFTPDRQYYVPKAEAVSVYDKTEDALLIGEGLYIDGNFIFDSDYLEVTLTQHSYIANRYYILENNQYVLATGDFDPNETYYAKVSQGEHIATRVDSITDGHLVEWDGCGFILVDSGKSIQDLVSLISNNTTLINSHKASKNNPHEVTAEQVGLGNVNNTSDLDKPISTATQTALDKKINFIEVDDIEALTSEQLDSLHSGDIVLKKTGNQKHAYIVSYKENNVGICLTYSDAEYTETVSYDHNNQNDSWEFNSKDSLIFQEKLISGTNIKTINNQSLVGSGNIDIKSYHSFKSNWNTHSTTADFCNSIVNDSEAVAGMTYLGQLMCSDLPAGMIQGEATVEIISNNANGKAIHITLTSVEISPYHWEYERAKVNGVYVTPGWQAYQLKLTKANVNDGTIDLSIGFDSNGNVVKGEAMFADQSYDPTSTNPQSGTAVAEAVVSVHNSIDENTTLNITSEMIDRLFELHENETFIVDKTTVVDSSLQVDSEAIDGTNVTL